MKLHIKKLQHKSAIKAGISLYMARADLLHPLASGNKIYKLNPSLEFAKAHGYTHLISFGGAFSNHIHALALMAKEQDFKSIGIIRGEKEYANNPTLKDATDAGMQLEFITRKDYKSRNEPIYLAKMQQQYPNALIIPEGGSSQLAVGGCSQLAKDIDAIQKGDILAVPCGTGATLAGLICGNSHYKQIHGYAVLLDDSLEARVQRFIEKEKASTTDYKIYKADFGGYAKISKELLDFIFNWLEQTGILLDPIYTSKMCMYLVQQIKAGEFQAGSTITIIHTGGLQGWRGMEKRVTQLAGIDKWNLINNNL